MCGISGGKKRVFQGSTDCSATPARSAWAFSVSKTNCNQQQRAIRNKWITNQQTTAAPCSVRVLNQHIGPGEPNGEFRSCGKPQLFSIQLRQKRCPQCPEILHFLRCIFFKKKNPVIQLNQELGLLQSYGQIDVSGLWSYQSYFSNAQSKVNRVYQKKVYTICTKWAT